MVQLLMLIHLIIKKTKYIECKNVKVEDKVKNYTIISNNITYFKNLEKFVSGKIRSI